MPETNDYKPDVCYDKVASIAAAATESQMIDLAGCKVVGLITPASLGATAITFKAATTDNGTFIDVNDETGAKITVTVHTSNAGWADLTNIFPASVRFVKVVTGTALANAKDITLATLSVASPKA